MSGERFEHAGGLITKLAKIMTTIRRMEKSERNTQGWSYASVMDIVDAVRPQMAEAGIIMFPDVEDVTYQEGQSQRGTATVTCHLTVRWTIVDAEGFISFRTIGEALDTSDKATNKALTAAQKLAVTKLFMITTGDEDADAGHVERKPRPDARPAPEDEGHGICPDHGIPYFKSGRMQTAAHKTDSGGWCNKPADEPKTEPKIPVNKWAQEFAALASKRFASQIEGIAWCRQQIEELNDRSVKNWTETDYERLVVLLREPVAAREG